MRSLAALLILSVLTIDLFAQTGTDQFEKCLKEFKSAQTIFITGSFKGFGKNAGKVIEAGGTVALQKDNTIIRRYKSFAVSEVALLGKINHEQVIFDGSNVYQYNQDTERFDNRGDWESTGKNYSGYSYILYGNLIATFDEFEKNKKDIQIENGKSGYTLILPSTESRGQIVIQMAYGSLCPERIIRYNEKSNESDFVVLSLSSLRYNISFPPDFFRIAASSESKINNQKTELPDVIDQNKVLLATGTQAPNWELINSNGVKRKLSDFRGKLVLMDFWATWCAPCVQAQPVLQRIHEKYKDVVVLGMNYNEKKGQNLNDYKRGKGISYEMILNAEQIRNPYNIKALPTAYLIDRTGKVIYSCTGYSERDEQHLIEAIEKAL